MPEMGEAEQLREASSGCRRFWLKTVKNMTSPFNYIGNWHVSHKSRHVKMSTSKLVKCQSLGFLSLLIPLECFNSPVWQKAPQLLGRPISWKVPHLWPVGGLGWLDKRVLSHAGSTKRVLNHLAGPTKSAPSPKSPSKSKCRNVQWIFFVAYGKVIADLAFASSKYIQYHMKTDLGSLESHLLTPIPQIW